MNTYPALWFTSGTPISIGQRDCAYARWLEFHAGPHGTGYRKRAQAVPLATGAAVHQGIELIGKWILDWQAKFPARRLLAVPDEVVGWAATEAAARYEAKARARGLEITKTDSTRADALDQLILEQRTLIEAQTWIYAIVRLPLMLASAKLLDVEREEGPVLDCTCGLGDWTGTWEQHAGRNCAGIVAQGRADFLWQLADDAMTTTAPAGTIVYEEFKTKATPNYGWEMSWEHSSQLFLNMTAAERRLGIPVTTAYVPVLFKGRRDRTDRDDLSSPKIQQSPLVWPWFDPGNGMSREPAWATAWRWVDEWGKGHTLGRSYTRRPIWDPQYPLDAGTAPNVLDGGVVIRPNASRVETWVKGWIRPVQYAELVKTLGPFPKPAALVGLYEQSVKTNERMWREDVEFLRGLQIYQPSTVSQTVSAADIIPRSWNCTRWDGTSCQFKPICHREPGWENIETFGAGAASEHNPALPPLYDIRTPHHGIEKAAYEKLGLVFPDQDEDEGESE